MSWDPGPRPAWVEAVNRGDVWPMTEVAARPFTLDQLFGAVAASLGTPPATIAARLGDDALEALEVLLPALEREAGLTTLGRWITHRFLGRLVEGRVALAAWVKHDPGVLDEPIVQPWFVIGAPRTGTTVLHGVLAQDPRHRAPEGWELLWPAPPPSTGDVAGRIELADVELRTPQVVASGLTAIHEYSARMPKECLSAMSFAFRSEEFVSRYHVPSYVAWLQACDMRPAYDVHRLVLQVLQRGAPPRRWVLKSPVHLQAIPTLRAVYPDARLSTTHRDPLTVLGSVTSLVATLRWAHSDHVDLHEIGRYHADLYAHSLDDLVDACRPGGVLDGRVTHSNHTAFLADPLGIVTGLYAAFGWDVPDDVRAAMQDYLDAHPQGAGGPHGYRFGDLGLDERAQRARFARYTERFAVPVAAVA